MGADPAKALDAGVTGDVKSFLLALSDALRPLGDPLAVQHAAAELLAKRLSASRAVYMRVRRDATGGHVHVVERDYFVKPKAGSLVGEYSLSDYGPNIFAGVIRGEVMSI